MKEVSPPKFGVFLINRLFDRWLQEAIEGDLYELFLEDLKKKGRFLARAKYLINVIMCLRYYRLRNSNSSNINHMGLFNNYLKVTFRNLRRQKLFTAINLFGLVAGFTVSLFMLEYVLHELSFDRFHSKADRIYRVIHQRYRNGESIQHSNITMPTIGRLMKKDFPEVIEATRILPDWGHIEIGERVLRADHVLAVDENFLSILDFEILYGDRTKSNLDNPYEVVLTESYARRLVSKNESLESLINTTIELNGDWLSKITAITKDPPTNSQLQFEVLVSYATYVDQWGERADNSMDWSDFYHYVLIDENVNIQLLNEKVAAFGDRYFEEEESSGLREEFYLQPLLGSHLGPYYEYDLAVVVNGRVVWMMLVIAILLVVVAWINFINLSSSRVLQKAKEVGVRKSLSATKRQIIAQVSIESLVLNIGSLAISFLLCLVLQPYFNRYLGLSLSINDLIYADVWGIPFLIIFLGGFGLLALLISVYPGALIASFRVQDVMKGTFKAKGEVRGLNHILIVFQYCISLLLVVAAVVVGRQVNFMMQKDLQISIEKTMAIYGPDLTPWDSTFISRTETLKNEIAAFSGVTNVTATNRATGNNMGIISPIRSSADSEKSNITCNSINIHHDFVETLGLRILAGRDFDRTDHHYNWRDVKNIMINESALDLFGFKSPEDAIGRTLYYYESEATIVGVVNDFHQRSLHYTIDPVIFRPMYGINRLLVKLDATPTEGLLAAIKDKYLEVFPGNHYDYYFLEDEFMALYENEERISKIINVFTVLGIVIAALGLYGLVLINISKKTKEIGLRRVLGAALHQIFFAVGKQLMILVLVAVAIGAPVSYLLLDSWRATFAYSVDMNVSEILISAGLLLLLAVSVLLIQTKRATRLNPSEVLRYE
ncbi:MAG: FtsX-like permease family protein [Bacteroidota bacterium]